MELKIQVWEPSWYGPNRNNYGIKLGHREVLHDSKTSRVGLGAALVLIGALSEVFTHVAIKVQIII